MASKGAYATGTDGSDFKHRETVASHYKVSAENKSRLRFLIILHWMMAVLMVVRLIPGIMFAAGVRPLPAFIRHINLPQICLWEVTWLLSSVASVLAFLALPKNNGQLLLHAMIGTIVFGVLPLLIGGYDLFDELTQYMSNKQRGSATHDQAAATQAAATMGFGIPAVVIFYLWIFIMLQIHMFALYCAQRLREAWRASLAPPTRGGRPVPSAQLADKQK